MAMSCADSKGKVCEPQIVKIDSTDEKPIVIGKPCIDFQPDDRWQIKEDKVIEKALPNSKIKDIKNNSNGRRSLRLRSSKSSDSASAINGEGVESGSEDDEPKNKNNDKPVENEDSENLNEHTRSLRKRPNLTPETEDKADCDTFSQKKMKLDISSANEVDKNSSNNNDDEKCDQKENTDDSNDKIAMPNLSPAATDYDKTSKNDDLDSSIEIIDSEKRGTTKEEPKSTLNDVTIEQENDCEVIPKLEKFKKGDNQQSDEKKNLNGSGAKIDSEIEIISINDCKKSESDDESDSEIQIINLDDSATTKPTTVDFPISSPPEGDYSISAGYPYYNSLKEKISGFKAGEYKPVKFPHTGTLLLGENEVIIESPSLLVPLLIKEADEFPKLEGEEKKTNGEESIMMRPNMISKRNFFQSSVGQFLINLGMSRVQEWYHRDMKRAKLRQLKSVGQDESLEKTVQNHEKRYSELKETNAAFNFRMLRCKYCNFKTESKTVMEGHYLTPHLTPRREYRCNFCPYLTRDPEAVIFHFEAMHGKKAVIDAHIPFHECIFCSFQSHLKTKVNAHMNRCRKHFIPSQNLAPPFDFEFPGVTTKPVTIGDVIGHRRLLLSSAKNQRLPMPEDNNPNSAYARKKLASVLSKLSGQNTYADMKNPSLMKQLMASQSQMPAQMSGSSIQLPPGIVITRPRATPIPQMRPVSGRYPQPQRMPSFRGVPPRRSSPYTPSITSAASHLASSGISITPVTRPGTVVPPRTNALPGTKNVTLTPISTASNRTVSQKPGPPQPVALFTNMAGSGNVMGQPQPRLPAVNMNLRPLRPAPPYQRLNTPPSQVIKGSSGNTFVMCEICDSYIKDLEELRTHMNWVHKVKIHPKMLVSRPPLNCQKCQWRFFTDQGLERHLLGAHGLVTTNMQEMANKNQDGGRCIICGAVFTYKLVSHMTQVHKVTLKPAHLSYKCTVCTATFTLYRLFESHVYNVHSGSAKRPAEETPSEPPPPKKITSADVGPRKCKDCGMVTENMQEHLIKLHIRECSVKLCRIEKCEKCLYSSDEMLVIRMSDFGLDDDLDDSGDDDDDDEESSDSDSGKNEKDNGNEVVQRLSDVTGELETVGSKQDNKEPVAVQALSKKTGEETKSVVPTQDNNEAEKVNSKDEKEESSD